MEDTICSDNKLTHVTPKQRLQESNSENICIFPLVKSVAKVHTSSIVEMGLNSIYSTTKSEICWLIQHKNMDYDSLQKMCDKAFFTRIHLKTDQDLVTLAFVMKMRHISLKSGKSKIFHARLKYLCQARFSLSLSNVSVAIANVHISLHYSRKRKFGKAWRYLEMAKSQLEHTLVNEWDAVVYMRQAQFYSFYAHLYPKCRQRFYKLHPNSLLWLFNML